MRVCNMLFSIIYIIIIATSTTSSNSSSSSSSCNKFFYILHVVFTLKFLAIPHHFRSSASCCNESNIFLKSAYNRFPVDVFSLSCFLSHKAARKTCYNQFVISDILALVNWQWWWWWRWWYVWKPKKWQHITHLFYWNEYQIGF